MTDDRARKRNPDDRVPPHNLEAEEALLGAAFLSAAALEAMLGTVEVRDYYQPRHQHIAEAVRKVAGIEGNRVDVVTVADQLRRDGLLDEIGGTDTLLALQNATPAVSNAHRYAAIVRNTATLRRLIHTATEIAHAAYLEPDDPSTAIATASRLLEDLGSGHLDALSGWDVADVGALLDGNLEPEQPTMLRRTDGGALLYAGKVHTLQAEPSSGKGWVALTAVAEILTIGGSAVYLDYEDTPTGILGRLVRLGVPPPAIRARFDYRRLSTKLGPAERTDLFGTLDRLNPDLVVIDGVAEALGREGLSEDKADDVVRWMDQLPRPIARTGAAVVLIDHVAKDPEQRGRWARGSGAKLAAIDGAVYQLKVRTAFSRHKAGRIELVVAKDRPGGVGAIGETVASLSIEPHGGGERVVVTVNPYTADKAATDTWRPTETMRRLYDALKDSAAPLAPTSLLLLVHGKNDVKREALQRLIAEGFVTETTKPKRLRIVRPFDADDDRKPARPWEQPPPELFDDYVDETDIHHPTPDELAELHRALDDREDPHP